MFVQALFDSHGHQHPRAAQDAPVAADIFTPMSFDSPPATIPSRDDHPQLPVGVVQEGPLQTNKFYASFFANAQDNRTWVHPYSVWWPKRNVLQGRGLSISHTDREDFIYGPGDPVESFDDTFFRQSLSLSAKELGNGTVLTIDNLTAESVNVNLAPSRSAQPLISFPLVQGMAFMTGIYNGASVLVQSQRRFSNITELGVVFQGSAATVHGWSSRLSDKSTWLIYITGSDSTSSQPTLKLLDRQTIVGPTGFKGIVQVAKNPVGSNGLSVFNKAAGAYPETGKVSGSVSGRSGTYSFSWLKKGATEQQLLMFALPHHVASFDQETASRMTSITLASTTKGIATAVLTDTFTMVENDLPADIGFDPWSPRFGSVGSAGAPGGTISERAKSAVSSAGKLELQRDITVLTNLTSKYFSGIAFSIYARSLYATSNIAGDTSTSTQSLRKLENAFDRYVKNLEPNPLAYDTVWGGVCSTASYGNNDSLIDFGNTYYNDHNFHYGYYVYTAAILGYLDPSWLTRNNSANKVWVNTLIRDWANPSAEDPFFPFSRSFDWYHGHSWARGVLESENGKDQESSAEDAFSTYAIKMWARVIGDPVMEARGNLQLAITARALQNYYLLDSNNTVQPPEFIGNRVAGILFDRLVNHTTYFGDQISFVQGIHMLPINPSSAYTRKAAFVREEWDQYFAGNKSGFLTGGGFVGHVYVNLAIADVEGARESYDFMLQQSVNGSSVDGLSLAWNLAYTAGLGGSLAKNSTVNVARRRHKF
ncbi:glycosyl hydrolase family 81 [Diaporthe helianthi]|uniref:glucan endo-1,3-beta-D-glucosidase n=1 Tax=Diaporthe helianthi TaxID=158607 RepID=A0A2P5HJ53_DIAHE|nr:glycosyl hydrolase family 81 [Diaporthe helianthi]